RNLIEVGKKRTAGKLRAYMRAAYEMARTAGMDAELPVRFKAYGVKHNPAAETKAVQRQTDKNPLSVPELRQYWNAIKEVQTFEAAVLRLHLLTGGQRLEQFCRLKTDDDSNGILMVRDPKGRPGRPPRLHPLPLIAAAKAALAQYKALAPTGRKSRSKKKKTENSPGTFLISTDGGKTSITADAMSKWAMAAGACIEGFSPKRVRSGVETTLASLRVSQEVRGRLLSHGVSGVQAASYDGHDYLDAKLETLEMLFRHLENASASVTHIAFEKAVA
ncbi:MAG: integrase, partial [Burkholderiaceae bacterium]